MFRSLIHFELIFVYNIRLLSNFILLNVDIQFSQHHLLKELSFSHFVVLAPMLNITWPCTCTFMGSILFYWSVVSVFIPVPHCHDYCRFVVCFEIRKYEAPNLVLFFFNFWLHWVSVAVRGLFSSCGEQGLLFIVVCGLLIALASLVAEHEALGAWASVVVACGLSSCGARA